MVEEDGGDEGRIGEEREDPHLAATGKTEQRQHVVDVSGTAHGILAGEAGAGAGSADALGEATSPSAAGASDTNSGRPSCTRWDLSFAFGASIPW